MEHETSLRDVLDEDLPRFFEHQLDPQANHMAAFTAREPTDRAAFNAHWRGLRSREDIVVRTIALGSQAVGYILSFQCEGKTEVGYWLGRDYWGRGIATRALGLYIEQVETRRPLFARVAKDNPRSVRVLERNGFGVIEETRGYAKARGEEIAELVLRLA